MLIWSELSGALVHPWVLCAVRAPRGYYTEGCLLWLSSTVIFTAPLPRMLWPSDIRICCWSRMGNATKPDCCVAVRMHEYASICKAISRNIAIAYFYKRTSRCFSYLECWTYSYSRHVSAWVPGPLPNRKNRFEINKNRFQTAKNRFKSARNFFGTAKNRLKPLRIRKSDWPNPIALKPSLPCPTTPKAA